MELRADRAGSGRNVLRVLIGAGPTQRECCTCCGLRPNCYPRPETPGAAIIDGVPNLESHPRERLNRRPQRPSPLAPQSGVIEGAAVGKRHLSDAILGPP